jgi:hypothetical protein
MTHRSTPNGRSRLVYRIRNLVVGQPKPVQPPEPSTVPVHFQPPADWRTPRLGGFRYE